MSELNPPDHSSTITCNQSSRNVSTIKEDLILCTCGINGGYNFKSRVELQLLRTCSFLPYNFGCVHRASCGWFGSPMRHNVMRQQTHQGGCQLLLVGWYVAALAMTYCRRC